MRYGLSLFLSPTDLNSLMPTTSPSAYLPALSPISSRYLRQLTTDMLIPISQLRLLDSIGKGSYNTSLLIQLTIHTNIVVCYVWFQIPPIAILC